MTGHNGTNAGTVDMAVGVPMYIHIDGEEFGGGQWNAN